MPTYGGLVYIGLQVFLRTKKDMSLLRRLYVWSIIVEPLLFFVIWETDVTGVTGQLSHLLQLVVIICLVLSSSIKMIFSSKTARIRFVKLSSPLYVNYIIYMCVVIVAGCFGFFSGGYSLPGSYSYNETEISFYQFVNSRTVRPFFEYLIILFYFVYFTVLPQYFLTNKKELDYFFFYFKLLFIISTVVGFIDLGLVFFNIHLVPLHIAAWVMTDLRFHGLAGEPRHAFIYLFFSLAMLHLNAYYRGVSFNNSWIAVVIFAALLTQSFSGVLGIIFFLGLYGAYSVCNNCSTSGFIKRVILLIPILGVVYVSTVLSPRIHDYVDALAMVSSSLDSGQQLSYLMSIQSSDIYPLYDLTVKFRNFNWLPIFIGSGLGSSSVINNIYSSDYMTIRNPNSQIVRIVFESGLLGSFFFIKSFTSPVKSITKYLSREKQQQFMMLSFLLVGIFLSLRSAACFIYLGVFIAVFRVLGANSTLGVWDVSKRVSKECGTFK